MLFPSTLPSKGQNFLFQVEMLTGVKSDCFFFHVQFIVLHLEVLTFENRYLPPHCAIMYQSSSCTLWRLVMEHLLSQKLAEDVRMNGERILKFSG